MLMSCLTILSEHWLLFLNVKVLHIDSTPNTGNYALEGIQLDLLDKFHGLGTRIHSKLKFYMLKDTVVKKVYHVFGLICKLFECKDSDIMVKVYTT